MELIRTWILTITASALVIAAAEGLMPAGAVKQVGKLTGGLILVLALLQPVAGADYGDLWGMVNSLPAGAIGQEELTQSVLDPMKGIIEEELAAYIVGKGAELGVDCTAQVTCRPGEDGVPVPQSVVVSGALTQDQKEALGDYIGQELGIPREYQRFGTISEETP